MAIRKDIDATQFFNWTPEELAELDRIVREQVRLYLKEPGYHSGKIVNALASSTLPESAKIVGYYSIIETGREIEKREQIKALLAHAIFGGGDMCAGCDGCDEEKKADS